MIQKVEQQQISELIPKKKELKKTEIVEKTKTTTFAQKNTAILLLSLAIK